jgi:hypothetical protein
MYKKNFIIFEFSYIFKKIFKLNTVFLKVFSLLKKLNLKCMIFNQNK